MIGKCDQKVPDDSTFDLEGSPVTDLPFQAEISEAQQHSESNLSHFMLAFLYLFHLCVYTFSFSASAQSASLLSIHSCAHNLSQHFTYAPCF